MKPYIPEIREMPKVVNVVSAWDDIPTILKDIITRFNLRTELALEFGVGFGYSTSALANYFDTVLGIDAFWSDGKRLEVHGAAEFEKVQEILKDYPNIRLIQMYLEDFIEPDNTNDRYDLIHIDVIHYYKETFRAGNWALRHSDCVIFHDTISFPDVFQVCEDLAALYNFEFYNYPESHGLGILIKNK